MTFTRHVITKPTCTVVDGQLPLERRADVLRLLATSKEDRATVESWQDQNDILRNAFAGVEREPLPNILNVAPLPYLRVASDSAPPLSTHIPRKRHAGSGRHVVAALSVVAVTLAGAAGAWTLRGATGWDGKAEARLDGPRERELAGRAITALDGFAGAAQRAARNTRNELPTRAIPDLGRAGFDLVRADAAQAPASLVFIYEDAFTDRVAISVSHAAQPNAGGALARIGEAYSWQRRDKVYAIAGTISAGRLRNLAVALQSGDGLD